MLRNAPKTIECGLCASSFLAVGVASKLHIWCRGPVGGVSSASTHGAPSRVEGGAQSVNNVLEVLTRSSPNGSSAIGSWHAFLLQFSNIRCARALRRIDSGAGSRSSQAKPRRVRWTYEHKLRGAHPSLKPVYARHPACQYVKHRACAHTHQHPQRHRTHTNTNAQTNQSNYAASLVRM